MKAPNGFVLAWRKLRDFLKRNDSKMQPKADEANISLHPKSSKKAEAISNHQTTVQSPFILRLRFGPNENASKTSCLPRPWFR